jgi:hypothetical protein
MLIWMHWIDWMWCDISTMIEETNFFSFFILVQSKIRKKRSRRGLMCIGETSMSIGMGSVKIFFWLEERDGVSLWRAPPSRWRWGRGRGSLSSTPFPMVRQFAPNPNYLDRKGKKLGRKLKGTKISSLSEDVGKKIEKKKWKLMICVLKWNLWTV